MKTDWGAMGKDIFRRLRVEKMRVWKAVEPRIVQAYTEWDTLKSAILNYYYFDSYYFKGVCVRQRVTYVATLTPARA